MNVNGKNLFPLHKLNYAHLALSQRIKTGYFMDAAGHVYSTRGVNGSLRQLQGTQTGLDRWYTFQGEGYSTIRFNSVELIKRAKAHIDFVRETKDQTVAITAKEKEQKSVNGRSYAASVEAGVSGKGSVIGRVHNGRLVFGSDPKIHMTTESVRDEMKRLAVAHPNVKFVELKIVTAVIAGGISWE